jgi:L-alanine-DL-glutamate epimerase-like enolase superfamily enzyme
MSVRRMSKQRTAIDEVDSWLCRIPLASPIDLGGVVIRHRDFVVLRVRTMDGIEGTAYSLSRGAPVDLVIAEMLAPTLVGRDALDLPRRLEEMRRCIVAMNPTGILQRAISLVDIALWDIKAQVAGLPLWRLLGGYRDTARVMVVAPYATADESDQGYAERLTPLAKRGYLALKLYPLRDPQAMARRLTHLRATFGDSVGLVVDMAWSWRSAKEAIRAVRSWDPAGLAWVEDPFAASDWRSMKALADSVQTPVGAGDEVTERSAIDTLIDERAVDVVRLDATTIGGLSEFALARESAAAAGLSVSPHAYPEIHRHAAFAWPDVGPIEIFPPGSSVWGTSRFVHSEVDLPRGQAEVVAPTEPGLGLNVDLDAVAALALRATAVRADR